jgi:Alpha/beta hydrolase domain
MTTGARAEGPIAVAVPGQPELLLGDFDLAPLGYTTSEFFISGTASSYRLADASSRDGHWKALPAEAAPYATRIVVVRPIDPNRFNGTLVVEWLNVSAGVDGAPEWSVVHREMIRNGYAYAAVSAQKVGVEGGPSLLGMGAPLKKANPERYGPLSHPGDAFAYDIFSQAGGILRSAGAGKILGTVVPEHVIAAGVSQSAAFLTTYVNAVDPLAKVYDGFLVHSRFGSAASLENASMAGAPGQPATVQFRTDLRAPVITVITETDLLVEGRIPGFYGARQPDNERLRIWEVAGTAHADNYLFTVGRLDSGSLPLEKLAAGYAPTANVLGMDLAKPVNNAPQHHYVVEAALWNLDRWIRIGQPPSQGAPIQLNMGVPGAPPSLVRDATGLARGGVRTPWVDVPTVRLSGVGNSGGPLGFMVGICEPFDAPTLDRLYPGGKSEYLKKFEDSLDSAIQAAFILSADRQEILGLAAFSYHGSH